MAPVVFVAFDGGRYEMSVGEGKVVEPGIGPQASWPAPLQHALIDVDNIRALAKGNAWRRRSARTSRPRTTRWLSCFNEVWKKTKPELDKVEARGLGERQVGSLGGIRKTAELNAPKTCEPKKKELDAALTKLIEARNVERLGVFEKAKARFK